MKRMVSLSQTMNNKLVTPAQIQWGQCPVILKVHKPASSTGFDQGRFLLGSLQAAEGLPRAAAYAFEGSDP